MNLVSYSQNLEDILLWRALRDVPSGTYLDVGAQHPERDSVSKLFYDRGWRGIHVEANPTYADLLRVGRPDEVVVEALVASVEASCKAEFYVIAETGLSTGVPAIAGRHATEGRHVEGLEVSTTTLSAVLDKFGGAPVHWMKVDVEGMECQVLESWGSNALRPWIVVVESTLPNSQIENWEEWIHLLTDRSYAEAYFDGLNRYFVHSSCADRVQAFVSPPCVFDGYAVTSSHFTAGLINHEAAQAILREKESQEARLTTLRSELEDCSLHTRLAEQGKDAALERLKDSREALALADARLVNANANAARQLVEVLQLLQAEREAATSLQEMRDADWAERLSQAVMDSKNASLAILQRAAEAHGALVANLNQTIDVERNRSRLFQNEATEYKLAEARSEANVAATRIRLDNLAVSMQALSVTRWFKFGVSLGMLPKALYGDEYRNYFLSAFGAVHASQHPEDLMNATFVVKIADLLEFEEIPFVKQAYRSVLGRDPDPAGLEFYAMHLREGRSKMFVLKALRQSQEAKAHIPGVAGLDRAIRHYRLANLPGVGRFIRLIFKADSESQLDRVFRSLKVRTFSLVQMIGGLKDTQTKQTAYDQAAQGMSEPNNVALVGDAQKPAKISAARTGLAGFFQSEVWGA